MLNDLPLWLFFVASGYLVAGVAGFPPDMGAAAGLAIGSAFSLVGALIEIRRRRIQAFADLCQKEAATRTQPDWTVNAISQAGGQFMAGSLGGAAQGMGASGSKNKTGV